MMNPLSHPSPFSGVVGYLSNVNTASRAPLLLGGGANDAPTARVIRLRYFSAQKKKVASEVAKDSRPHVKSGTSPRLYGPTGCWKLITNPTGLQEARNERVVTPLNIDQALDARDAISKVLYSSLFSWLVHRINQIVYKGARKMSISILDIFGFEDFKV